ncbi:MAG: galactokinase [Planctomycetota bacterium]|nr:galactokinase [Planctomycetota bacterium]
MALDFLELKARFVSTFGPADPGIAFGPGRVNIIGEHTDYNGGLVLPFAIDRGVAVAFRPAHGTAVRVVARQYGNEEDTFDVRRVEPGERRWGRYVRGVVRKLEDAGYRVAGACLMVDSDLPVGAGLSSSAALEMATLMAFSAMGGYEVPPTEAARLCQKAEHDFAGVRCGIMDQTVSRMGREDHALLLDCDTMAVAHVPIRLAGHAWLLLDTGVRHELGASEYNRRRAECEAAATLLAPGAEKPSLRRADVGAFADLAAKGRLTPAQVLRVRHVMGENLRVAEMCAALAMGDAAWAGRLLDESHASLRDFYQVSCPELDLMADLCRRRVGCRGARMVGGGFGGSVLALVEESAADSLARDVLSEYSRKAGREGTSIAVRPAGGARLINPPAP